MQDKNTTIKQFTQLILKCFLSAAVVTGLAFVSLANASNWSENSTADFSDGYFFHTTSTIDNNDIRISAWNDWMSDQWQTRRKITINNTNGSAVNLVNYQMDITVNTKELIDSSRMRQDMNDIRFTDEDGKTLISYYYVLKSSGTATKITVKVPYVALNSQKTIYMYYGNATSSFTLSNIQAVYDLFEDWESGSVDGKWTRGGGALFHLVNDNKYSGNYSLQSGSVALQQVSFLSLSVNQEMTSSLTFYWAMNGADFTYDSMQFWIDDVEPLAQYPQNAQRISGVQYWQQRIYQIPAGNHTLKWIYSRGSYNMNLGLGWIDNIVMGKYSANPPVISVDPMSNEENHTAYYRSALYQSNVFDTGGEDSIVDRASWTMINHGISSVSLKMRSSNTSFSKNTSNTVLPWSSQITNRQIDPPVDHGRYLQYLAEFIADGTTSSYLLDMSVTYRSPPPRPTNFSGTVISSTTINWIWKDNASGLLQEQGITMFSSSGGIITSLLPDTTEWIETNLAPNKIYSRYVGYYNAVGTNTSTSASYCTMAEPPAMNAEVFGFISSHDYQYVQIPTSTELFGSSFTFTSDRSTGTIEYYRIAFNTSPTYSFLPTDTSWAPLPPDVVYSDSGDPIQKKPEVMVKATVNADTWYFHAQSYNKVGQPSGAVHLGPFVFHGTPSQITDLCAVPSSGSEGKVVLSWTAPCANGTGAQDLTNGNFVIKARSNYFITNDSQFNNAELSFVVSTSVVKGQPLSYVISGLTPGTTWGFAIKSIDSEDNWSSLSTNITDVYQTRTTASKVAKIIFMNPALQAYVGLATSKLTVECRDKDNNPMLLASEKYLYFNSTSGNAEFSLLPSPWVNTSFVSIPAGSGSAEFYYKDINSGQQTLTVYELPDAGWNDGHQSITILPGKAVQYLVDTVPSRIIGQTASVLIKANDGYNSSNTSIDYLGTAIVSATIAGSVLSPSNCIFTSAEAGQITATWSNTRNIAGPGSVSVKEVVAQQYRDIYFSDTLNALACGSEGLIKRSGNAGSQWFAMRSTTGTANGMSGIASDTNGVMVVASGKAGSVYVSSDSAVSFGQIDTGLGEDLNAVVYVGTMTAFVCGNNGKIGRSYDGGVTWSDISPGTAEILNSLCFVSSSTGFACGASRTLLKTVNGGDSWNTVSLPGSSNEQLNKLVFYDAAKGYAAGNNGKVYATTNGGLTWADVSPAGVSDAINGISFVTGTRGIAVGTNRTLLRTIDGGTSWTRLLSTGSITLTAVDYAGDNANVAVAAGYNIGDNSGVILQTRDGGTTWNEIIMQGQSSNVNWNGLVVDALGTAQKFYQRKLKQSAVKLTARNFYGGTSVISQLRVKITGGTCSYSDVAAIQFYRDQNNNGILDASDQKLGNSAPPDVNGLAIVSGFSNTLVNNATYFIVADVAENAVIGKTIGFSIEPGCLIVTGIPLASNNLPALISPIEIVPSSVTISMNISNVSPLEVKQGQRDVIISSFSLITTRGDSQWQRMAVSRYGINSNDSDIEKIKIYSSPTPSFNDANAVPVSTAVFGAISAGAAYLNLNETINETTTNYYFLTVDISANAAFSSDQSDSRFWLNFTVSTASFILDNEGSNGISCSTGSFTSNRMQVKQAYDTLTVESLFSAPDFDIEQSVNKLIMPLKLNVVEDGGRVDLVRIRLTEEGNASDSDIASVQMYRDTDGNGIYNKSIDSVIGTAQFSGSIADIIMTSPETIVKTSAGSNYFIAVTVAKRAVTEKTIIFKVDAASYILAGSDVASATHSSFTTPAGTIKNYRDSVNCSFSSLVIPEVRVDETGIAVSRITMNAYCSAILTRLTIEYAGNGLASDVSLVKIFRADDGSGRASSEVLIGTAAFGGDGKAVVNFVSPPVIYDSSATFVVRYDINPLAAPQHTLGMGIADTDFVFPSGDTAYHYGYYVTSLMKLLNKETPSLPAVALNISWPSGKRVGEAVTYFVSNANELSFSWDAAALSGIAQTQYALASFRVVSSTETPDITGWVSTTDRNAVLSDINLRHGQTYYFWVKAISGNGYERVTCCEMKADLTLPVAPGQPTDTSPRRNASPERVISTPSNYWVSWPDSVEDVSGILYYEVQEREDTSPLWVNIATTTAAEYKVIKDSITDSGHFFYYRVRARNYAGTYSNYSESSSAAYLALPLELVSGLCSYPNPFDSRVRPATISFVLNRNATVAFKIYDLFGGIVKDWKYDGAPGENRITWDGTDSDGRKVAAGMYILYSETRTGDTTIKKRWKIGVVH